MTITLLTLALLSAAGCRCAPWECHELVTAAVRAGDRHGVPPRVLIAVALIESGGDPLAVGHPRRGGLDLGAWQLHVTDHRPAIRAALASVAGLHAGAEGAAMLLAQSRRRCRGGRCRCIWALYNPGSRTWCRQLARALRGPYDI